MRHVIGTVFAIGLAGVAAIAATTAFLNSPLRIGAAPTDTPTTTPQGQLPAPEAPAGTPAPAGGAKPATPGEIPDAPPRGASAPAPAAATPAAEGQKADEKPDVEDKDPYEGIAPEELPPDLQYDADSSVSFPTNI
jgi:hypothetical protein